MENWFSMKHPGHALAWGLRTLLVIGVLVELVQGHWANTGILLMSVGASGIVYYLAKHWLGETGQYLDLLFALLVVFNNLLGLVLDFYHTVPGWDIATHYTTSLFLAVSALIIAQKAHPHFLLNEKPLLIVFFMVIFSLGLGGLWEIGEFSADYLRGTDFQHGLTNTMQDLMIDAIAGLIVGIAWVRARR